MRETGFRKKAVVAAIAAAKAAAAHLEAAYAFSRYGRPMLLLGRTRFKGRQGSAEFNLAAYKANNADLVAAFGDNNQKYYEHYLNSGKAEGRKAA